MWLNIALVLIRLVFDCLVRVVTNPLTTNGLVTLFKWIWESSHGCLYCFRYFWFLLKKEINLDYGHHAKQRIGSNKKFGISMSVILLLLGLWLFHQDSTMLLLTTTVSLIFLFTGLKAPEKLSKVNNAWSSLGFFLGRLLSPIILVVLFFVLFFPVAIFTKIFRIDLLDEKQSTSALTYWKPRTDQPSSMKNPW